VPYQLLAASEASGRNEVLGNTCCDRGPAEAQSSKKN
jgi:hypothetical protein